MISLLQVAVPLGIVLGYLMTSLLIEFDSSWKQAFRIQSYIIGAGALLILFIPMRYFSPNIVKKHIPTFIEPQPEDKNSFDLKAEEPRGDLIEIEETKAHKEDRIGNNALKNNTHRVKTNNYEIEEGKNFQYENQNHQENPFNRESITDNYRSQNTINRISSIKVEETKSIYEEVKKEKAEKGIRGVFKSIPLLMKNWTLLACVLGMSCLFFVITIIQFWVSDYMEKVLKIEKNHVFVAFVVVCVSSPTMGVLAGGIITGMVGGYESKRSIYLCVIGAGLASSCAIPCSFVNSFWPFVILLWLILFFGGMILPCLTGLAISSVSKEFSGQASSFNIIMTNLLGYIPAPYIYGLIYDETYDSTPKLAMRIGLLYSWVGFLCILITAIIRTKFLSKKKKDSDEKLILDEDPHDKEAISTTDIHDILVDPNSYKKISMVFHTHIGNNLVDGEIDKKETSDTASQLEDNQSEEVFEVNDDNSDDSEYRDSVGKLGDNKTEKNKPETQRVRKNSSNDTNLISFNNESKANPAEISFGMKAMTLTSDREKAISNLTLRTAFAQNSNEIKDFKENSQKLSISKEGNKQDPKQIEEEPKSN